MPDIKNVIRWFRYVKKYVIGKKIYPSYFLLMLFSFGFATEALAQCGTGAIPLDLSSSPDATIVTPLLTRNEPGSCITFSITLHPGAQGIRFAIQDGANPPGALTYSINCGPSQTYGQIVCLTGVGPHIVTFCKPGNNANSYAVTSVPNVQAQSNSPTGSSVSSQVCEGGTLSLTATTIPNATYSWSGPNGFASNVQNPIIPNVSAAAAGTYTVVVTAPGSCGTPSSSTQVTINPKPATPIATANGPICEGGSISLFASTIPGASYSWTGPNGFTSSLQNPVINNASTAASGTYTVRAVSGNCISDASTTNVVVNPKPVATATPTVATLCSGTTSTIILSSNVASTTFSWTVTTTGNITGASAGSGSSINQNLVNTGTNNETVTYTITPTANGCAGDPITVTLTVAPTPQRAPITPLSQTICSGSSTNLPLSSTVANTTFSWIVTQNGVTGAFAGSGTSINQILSTTGASSGTATYTVTPILNGCSGTSFNITVSVNPLPVVTVPNNLVYCDGDNVPVTNFSSTSVGTTFSWTSSNPALGLAASGTGNLPSFTATNTTNAPITSIIIVRGTANGCEGAPASFSITVNPRIIVSVPSNLTVCDNTIISASNFSSNLAGTTYTWTNSNTSIGLASSGTDNLPSFTATNTSGATQTATITVTPSLNGCTGIPSSYTITVEPLPNVTVSTTQTSSCGTNDGTITVTATGTGTLAYSKDGGITFQASNVFTNLPAGSYPIAVRNALGCIVYANPVTSVTAPNPPVKPQLSTNNPVCVGEVFSIGILNPDNNTTYNWTGPNGFTATGSSITINNPTAGSYAVTAITGGCSSESETFSLVVKPSPIVNVPSNMVVCNNSSIPATNFSSNPNGATYTWTNDNTAINLPASGNGNINSFTATNNTNSPITATITVTPSLNGCVGTPRSYTITVNPSPIVTATPPSQSICSGSAPSIQLSSNIPGTTYSWTVVQTGVSGATSGTGDVINQVITATSGTAVYTITPTANGCVGNPINVTINVYAVPVVETTAGDSQEICSGTNTNIPLFSSTSGTTYNWTVVQNGVTGAFNGSGTGPIAQNLVATSNVTGTAVYTIIPVSNACTGNPITVTVFVKPLAEVSVPNNFEVCAESQIPASVFTSTVAGTIYNWTNSNPAIGLVASGGGNVPSFIAKNTGTTPITGTITVTPSLNGCNGPSKTYIITVKPQPIAIKPNDITVCAGNTVAQEILQSLPSGATYTWTNSNSAIGLASSGIGNIPAFTAINASGTPVTAVITIIPTVNGCIGLPTSYSITVNPSPNLNISPAEAIICAGGSVTLTVSGANSYVWSPATGLNTTSSATVVASPSVTTTYTVFGVGNFGCAYAKTVKVIVNPRIVLASTIKNVSCNGANDGEININISGGIAPYNVSYSLNSGPSSSLINTSSGLVNFNNLSAGNYSISVIDAVGCTESINIVINQPSPLLATASINNTTCKTSSDGSITITPNGGTAPYSYSWVNQNSTSAVLNNVTAGNYTVIIRDANNCTFSLSSTISSGNCPPVALDDNFVTAEDTPINAIVATNDIDADGDVLTFTRLSNPANGSISFNSNGSFTFVPNSNWSGTTFFDYRVCDPLGLCDIARVTITVTPVNDAPVANDDNFTQTEDNPINATVTTNDFDIDGDALVYTRINNPANGSLIFNPNGTFTFTPNPNWHGTTSFDYQVCDPNNLCDIATVTIRINPVNDPPTAVNDNFFEREDRPVQGTVGTNDSDPDGDNLTFIRLSSPANGNITFNNNGTFTFTPNSNWNGTTSFDYQACDSFGLCTRATVFINITPVNDPPIAINDNFTGVEDVTINGNVAPNDRDIDGDPLSFNILTNPANGSITFNTNGTFNFRPNTNWNGNTTFTYRVCDNQNLCDTATVTIVISPINDPPTAINDRFLVLKDSLITETVARNDYDVDGDFLTFTRLTSPMHGSITFSGNGSFTYVPNRNFVGRDSIRYRICDPLGLCDTATVLYLVQPRVMVNLIPPTGEILEGESITIRAQLTEALLEDVIINLAYTGTANFPLDYELRASTQSLFFPAGSVFSADSLIITSKIDALKEPVENVEVNIASTSSIFVLIGTGSNINIVDKYPESKPIGPEENPDINPDPFISPNGDGIGNEGFIIYNIEKYPDNELIIFNRWGNAVFRARNYNNKDNLFTGSANTGILTNENVVLVDGVYYFLIYTTDNTGVKRMNKGYIIIRR
ncbi:Ig-like domain-containing protein [Pedobacter puniceum]|uniref:Tandem-95 repeat protein n=1 Tax=Pedobacter puniceum TaxID=2666136 RepID=A0A7K0FRD0_9SPHI|nr:Ig-like domain-containing protein [Pedobacter puniceum]MRX48556.1 tandem-95 repeat protein [Pedobacter puniceum]